MHSRWRMVDSLLRELGALRDDARALDPRLLDERIAADIDRHIANAAQAVDKTIIGREDEDDLLGVCEAIVVARDRIEALRAAVKRSGAIVEKSLELRKQAAQHLYEMLKTRDGSHFV
jgi:hypothetical protein